MKKIFEVIKFTEHNGVYRIGTDSVLGESLNSYIEKESNIKKDKLFEWMIQIVNEMIYLEKSKEIEKYSFLMPFSIVIKEDGKIALLNLKVKTNQKRVDQILEKQAFHIFFPEDSTYNDIYSFGKTLQYILARTNFHPYLTKKEEKIIQKIVSKCLNKNPKKTYHSFGEILLTISKLNKKRGRIYKVFWGIVIVLSSIILLYGIFFFKREDQYTDKYLSEGIDYFVTLNNYGKSEELFIKSKKHPLSKYYREMAVYMQGNSSLEENDMEKLLEEFEAINKENLGYEEKYCMLKVYNEIKTKTAAKNVIRLAEDMLDDPEWYRNEQELRGILEQKKLP